MGLFIILQSNHPFIFLYGLHAIDMIIVITVIIIPIMHIREVVSKNYSPRGNFIKSETHEAESRVCFGVL